MTRDFKEWVQKVKICFIFSHCFCHLYRHATRCSSLRVASVALGSISPSTIQQSLSTGLSSHLISRLALSGSSSEGEEETLLSTIML